MTHGYTPVGFDHFAKPGGDPLAHAALGGRLHRNFQGFTDDAATNLVGLGASAISSFPHLLAQNEKNSGRYRMRAAAGHLAADRGIHRSQTYPELGAIIEALLCRGSADLPPLILEEIGEALGPFVERGLASLTDRRISISPEGLPYARTWST